MTSVTIADKIRKHPRQVGKGVDLIEQVQRKTVEELHALMRDLSAKPITLQLKRLQDVRTAIHMARGGGVFDQE